MSQFNVFPVSCLYIELTESLISTRTSFFTFNWFLPAFNIGALKMFFVSIAKCVCMCMCVLERGGTKRQGVFLEL